MWIYTAPLLPTTAMPTGRQKVFMSLNFFYPGHRSFSRRTLSRNPLQINKLPPVFTCFISLFDFVSKTYNWSFRKRKNQILTFYCCSTSYLLVGQDVVSLWVFSEIRLIIRNFYDFLFRKFLENNILFFFVV